MKEIFLSIILLIVLLKVPAYPSVLAEESIDLVLIEKSSRRLSLISGDRKVAYYTVALGQSPLGPKRCQGDGKTPEGEYQISGRNLGSAYHRSLSISYPNQSDLANSARLNCLPGGDIMIHGLPNRRGIFGPIHTWLDWTKGCVAVTNSEIEEIWKLVKNGTRVKIVP